MGKKLPIYNKYTNKLKNSQKDMCFYKQNPIFCSYWNLVGAQKINQGKEANPQVYKIKRLLIQYYSPCKSPHDFSYENPPPHTPNTHTHTQVFDAHKSYDELTDCN